MTVVEQLTAQMIEAAHSPFREAIATILEAQAEREAKLRGHWYFKCLPATDIERMCNE